MKPVLSRVTRLFFALASCAGLGSTAAHGAIWSSTNVQYLKGDQHELGDEERSIITLEHASGWKYGDNFFFVDVTNPDKNSVDSPTGFYGEYSPRFSLLALAGQKPWTGFIKDILQTDTIEMGEGFHNYLYGLAVDLNMPGFAFFQVNYYIRNEITAKSDVGSQLTLAWGAPFSLGPTKWMFEGFLDYAWGLDNEEAGVEDNVITAPRLLLDVGNFLGTPNTLHAGVEYQIWRNKFGIKDVDEDVAQLMLKWTF